MVFMNQGIYAVWWSDHHGHQVTIVATSRLNQFYIDLSLELTHRVTVTHESYSSVEFNIEFLRCCDMAMVIVTFIIAPLTRTGRKGNNQIITPLSGSALLGLNG